MPKVSGFNRKRIGHRNYIAKIESPPVAEDDYGHVTYTSGTWTTLVNKWPCELIDAAGSEIIQGFAVKAATDKVAIGDSKQLSCVNLNTKCRVTIRNKVYGVTAVRDVSGDGLTTRIELKAIE
jgi:hypothetical protein